MNDDETRNSWRPPERPSRTPGYWNSDQPPQMVPYPATAETRRRSGLVLPVAIVVAAAVIAGLATWIFMHRGSSPRPGAAPTVASAGVTSPASSSTLSQGTTSTDTSVAPPSTTTSTETSTAAPTISTTDATNSVADFPPGTVSTCVDYDASGEPTIPVGDDNVRAEPNHGRNSCDFVRAAATGIRGKMSSSGDGSFSLSVFSHYRKEHAVKGGPYVDLTCDQSGGVAHCTSTGNSKVDMYVKQ